MSSVPSRCLLAVLLLLLSPFAARADCPPKLADKGHRLNGHPLKARWPQVQLVADTVLSELGAYEENGCNSACIAAFVTWWGLKEGTFNRPNGFLYSECTELKSKRLECARLSGNCKKLLKPRIRKHCFSDVPLHETDVCQLDPCRPGWQVGLAGLQVQDARTQDIETLIHTLYGSDSDVDLRVLGRVWQEAGFDLSDPRFTMIANDAGDLRKSWLLRDLGLSFILEARAVRNRCFPEVNRGECFKRGKPGDLTTWFAPDAMTATKVIGELQELFDCAAASITTTTSTTSTTTTTTTVPVNNCADIFDCNAGAEVCCNGQCKPNPYAGQSVCSTLYTPACTLCRTDSDCHCNPMYPIFCDSCGGGDSIFSCVNPCS